MLTPDKIEVILVFSSAIIGVVSAAYFYLSTDIFVPLLKRPLKLISAGMFLIVIGVLVAAFISYAAKQNVMVIFFDVPLQVTFYLLYIVGSLMILFGSRKFTKRARK